MSGSDTLTTVDLTHDDDLLEVDMSRGLEMHVTIPADLGMTKVVRSVVTKLLEDCEADGAGDPLMTFMADLGLEEAIVNAIIHGNLENNGADAPAELRSRSVQVRMRIAAIDERATVREFETGAVEKEDCNAMLRIDITDEGNGFDVDSVADPTQDDALARSNGRGLLLMRRGFDVVQYPKEHHGSMVSMILAFRGSVREKLLRKPEGDDF